MIIVYLNQHTRFVSEFEFDKVNEADNREMTFMRRLI